MHDIKAIRDNPALYDAAWASKGLVAQSPTILDLDRDLRTAQTALQAAQSRRHDVSKLIGVAKGRKDDAAAAGHMAEVELLKAEITAQGEAERVAGEALRALV